MKRVTGSFRDPSGYVYKLNDELFRAIRPIYQEDFNHFIGSGLYDELCRRNLIIRFSEPQDNPKDWWKTIKPEFVPFISYPYEWSFEQLKDAALATLDIQLAALEFGMILKDASAYNIQFYRGRPVHIDHLSFERLQDGVPWVAYRQFVMHFYGPLALMSKSDFRHGAQLRNFTDGLPLDYISSNLPFSSFMNTGFLLHIHLHSKLQKFYSNTSSSEKQKSREKIRNKTISKKTIINLAKSLKSSIEKLALPRMDTEWGEYYRDTNYTEIAFKSKQSIVERIAERFKPRRVGDLGANDGTFSRIFSDSAEVVVCADIDYVAVGKSYSFSRSVNDCAMAHVIQDLCNPSPSLGWANQERDSFTDRSNFDFVMALALVHHLCIAGNIPISYVANYFSRLSPLVLIEFVPKEDSQVKRLLTSRVDIFPDYSLENCIMEFNEYYSKYEVFHIEDSCRTLLLFSRN